MKNVQIGLLGAGQRLRGVVKGLLEAGKGNIQIRAVYDPDPGSQQAVRDAFGETIEVCASEEALFQHPEVDWICIGSINSEHARQAVAALEAGKHVFCEKPLATTLEDCLKVRDAVEKTGKIFSFGLVLRYSPHYQRIQQLLREGRIGRLISFEFNETLSFNHGGYIFGNWRRNRNLAGTHLLEKCCHDLDLANWIVGSQPVKVASFGGRDFFIPEEQKNVDRIGPNAEGKPAYSIWPDPHRVDPFSEGATILDNQVAILEYANGARATFHTNCNTAMNERRFYLCGTEGTLRADAITSQIELKRIGHDTEVETFSSLSTDGHAGGDRVMAAGLASTMLQGTPPQATVEDGIRACVVAFGLDQAVDENRIIDLREVWQSLPGIMHK